MYTIAYPDKQANSNFFPFAKIDPLPNWSYHHYRPSEDSVVLRAETESKRDGSVLCRVNINPDKMDVYRFCGRDVRDIRVIR